MWQWSYSNKFILKVVTPERSSFLGLFFKNEEDLKLERQIR